MDRSVGPPPRPRLVPLSWYEQPLPRPTLPVVPGALPDVRLHYPTIRGIRGVESIW